ncbi:MAG: cell division protein FtsQ/DivIB [Christensenellales bacterium]
MRRWFFLLLVASIAVVLYFEVLIIRHIEFTGNNRFNEAELFTLSGIVYEDSLLRLDTDAVQASLQQNPYIAVEKIEKRYPSTVAISISERKAVAVTDFGGTSVLLDAEGIVLSLSAEDVQENMTSIGGWTVEDAVLGEKIQTTQELQLSTFSQAMREIVKQRFLPEVKSLDLSALSQIQMELHNGMQVKMGTTDRIERKVAWMSQMVPELIAEGYSGGLLDVSAGTTASYSPGKTPENGVEE